MYVVKRKILFVMGSLQNGGGERSLINLLQLMDYKKYDVDLVLFKNKGIFLEQLPKEVTLLNCCDILHFLYNDSMKRVIDLKHPYLSLVHIYGIIASRIKGISGYQRCQYKWKNIYKDLVPQIENKYDVAVSFLEGETMMFLVDKVNADKKITWVHTDYSQIQADHNIDSEYFDKLDLIVTISSVCKEMLEKYFPSISKKIIELPNLIDSKSVRLLADEFYPEEYDNSSIIFLSVGRLVRLKGFDMAIKAASILKRRGIKFHWYVIGDGEAKQELQGLIKSYNVSECFRLLGKRRNPYAYMKNADIIIQTSRYEGKSIVLDEAKILGKPIVSTNYNTVSDQITNVEGIVVDMEPESIANGIESMILNMKKYTEYLLNNDYGNQSMIHKYYDLFD